MSNRILIKGVPFDQLTRLEVIKIILKMLTQNKQFLITTPNPEFIVESEKNPEFKQILQKADLSVADGIGILWASTYLNLLAPHSLFQTIKTLLWTIFAPQKIRRFLPERVCGSDLFCDLCQQSQAKIFLLGASEGVAEKTAIILKQKNPQIQIVGTYAGSPAITEDELICQKINQSRAELLFVAYGSPKQEFWINRNLSRLKTVKVALGIGGSFDFIAGTQKRAPVLFQKLGLEWLWRLIREPKRFKRIWNATVVFIQIILKYER